MRIGRITHLLGGGQTVARQLGQDATAQYPSASGQASHDPNAHNAAVASTRALPSWDAAKHRKRHEYGGCPRGVLSRTRASPAHTTARRRQTRQGNRLTTSNPQATPEKERASRKTQKQDKRENRKDGYSPMRILRAAGARDNVQETTHPSPPQASARQDRTKTPVLSHSVLAQLVRTSRLRQEIEENRPETKAGFPAAIPPEAQLPPALARSTFATLTRTQLPRRRETRLDPRLCRRRTLTYRPRHGAHCRG